MIKKTFPNCTLTALINKYVSCQRKGIKEDIKLLLISYFCRVDAVVAFFKLS